MIIYNSVQFKPAGRDKLCFHDHIMWSADNIYYHAKVVKSQKLSWDNHLNLNNGVYNKNTLKRKDAHYLLYVKNSDMFVFLHETNKKCNIIIMNLIFSITMRPWQIKTTAIFLRKGTARRVYTVQHISTWGNSSKCSTHTAQEDKDI